MESLASLRTSVEIVKETFRHLQASKTPASSHVELKRSWADKVLASLKVDVEVVGQPTDANSVLFVGNHISYLDIPLLMKTVPAISFVAKSEIASWPLFGSGAQAADTIFVKRENGRSRGAARESVKKGLQAGKRIAIFPAGTTCLTESKPWRYGAFEIAAEENVALQPFRISYSPLRKVAYIDRDFFPLHLYSLGKETSIVAKIEFHAPIHISDARREALYWQYWARREI